MRFSNQIADFYDAELSANETITFHFLYRPVTAAERANKSHHTHATVLDNHAWIEFLDNESPKERLDVALHELFHYFFRQRLIGAQRSLARAFINAPQPFALGAYGFLDEILATALGNGLVGERVLTPDAFAAELHKPLGFYDQPDIDALAKAILPWLRENLGKIAH